MFFPYMDSSSENSKKLSPPRRGIQGPKPPPLKVGKHSCMVKKESAVAPAHHQPPIIIHMKPPEVIHVEARNFKNIVQQLTGPSSSSSRPSSLPSSGDGVDYNFSREGNRKKNGELKLEGNVEVDPMFHLHDDMGSSGLPSVPFPPPSPSFFPSPIAYPDFYDFEMISDTPDHDSEDF